MRPATTPEILERQVRDLALLADLQGFLLSGGSNRRNEIAYERFLPAIEFIKSRLDVLQVDDGTDYRRL